MIHLVTGKIGAGKTLWSLTQIIEHIKNGGTVATNIKLNWPNFRRYISSKYKVVPCYSQYRFIDLNSQQWDRVIPWGSHELPVKVFLDEVHLFFNSRDWSKTQTEHKDMLSFLTQSRKAGVDVYFISQLSGTVDKQLRSQAQFEIYLLNSAQLNFGPLGKCPWNFGISHKIDMHSREKLETNVFPYSSKLFGLYDSFDMLNNDMQDRRNSVEHVQKIAMPKPRHNWRMYRRILRLILRKMYRYVP